jgi:hypothetical protein
VLEVAFIDNDFTCTRGTGWKHYYRRAKRSAVHGGGIGIFDAAAKTDSSRRQKKYSGYQS